MNLKRDESAVYRLRELYETYGYTRYKMSKFEEYDLYVRNKSFLVSDHVITFTDTNGRLMALKPDVTLSIVKNCRVQPGCVQKVHYNENVYRVSRGSGSYKEILQSGLECMGAIDEYQLSEVLTLAVKSLQALSGEYILEISHLGILSQVLDAVGAAGALRQQLLDCMGEKNLHGIRSLCREAGLDPTALESLMDLCGTPETVLPRLGEVPGCREAAASLFRILDAVPGGNLRLDFSLTGDMNYYNGVVFRGFVSGIPTGILSGGQYDRLMQKLGKHCGAVGFAVYLDLLEELPREQEKYDTDAVLLYDETVSPAAVSRQVETLTGLGMRVTAGKTMPEKLRCRQVLKMTESGVSLLENRT